jgi:hypothetical protein
MNQFNPRTSHQVVVNFALIIFFILSLCSCSGIRTIPRSEFLAIDQTFKGTFTSKVCKFRGATAKYNVYELFEVDSTKDEKFKIDFDSIGRIRISSNSGKWSSFGGKFKRGFYQVYLRKKWIQIPPIFPLIYSDVDIYRIRIAYHKYGYLLLENKYYRDKSILFLGGGRGQRNVYFFSQDKCD